MPPLATRDAIQTVGLTKRFGRTLALDQLDLTVEAGEVFGFLGPNGAGKATAIRLLLGHLRPTAGQSWIFGHASGDAAAAHRHLAYVPADVGLWPAGLCAYFLIIGLVARSLTEFLIANPRFADLAAQAGFAGLATVQGYAAALFALLAIPLGVMTSAGIRLVDGAQPAKLAAAAHIPISGAPGSLVGNLAQPPAERSLDSKADK
jgi:energy-coupling factor transporter ATP-binding protein EcfA2